MLQLYYIKEVNSNRLIIKVSYTSEAQKKKNEDKKTEEKKEYEKIFAERKIKKEYEERLKGKREDMPTVKTDLFADKISSGDLGTGISSLSFDTRV